MIPAPARIGPISMKTLKVSRMATPMMTTRPTLRSSWAMVCPRRSRGVAMLVAVVDRSLDPLAREPDNPVGEDRQEPDCHYAGAVTGQLRGVDLEDVRDPPEEFSDGEQRQGAEGHAA